MEGCRLQRKAFDLVFSSLALQWVNDLRATFAEFARVSRPGALLLFSSFGPGTLQELAASWQALDDYPHVHQFIDMHDVGDAMLAAGFAQPVVDAETIRLEYREFRIAGRFAQYRRQQCRCQPPPRTDDTRTVYAARTKLSRARI